MQLPPNDSPLWLLCKLAIVGAIMVGMAAFGTQNGFDWRTDIPALLAVLGGLGIVQGAQRLMAPKE